MTIATVQAMRHRPGGAWPAQAGVVLAAIATGAAVGEGHPQVALALVALPIGLIVLAALAGPQRSVLVLVALAVGLIGAPLDRRLPLPFGFGVWGSDLLLAAAIAGWTFQWLVAPRERRPRLTRTPVLGLAWALFAGAMLLAAWRGHERYGATLIGMPLRLVGYAAFAFALTDLTPTKALRGLTTVSYACVSYAAGLALYHVLTGTSSSRYLDLSTGGIRYVGISTATFAAGTLILATVNLAGRKDPAWLHLGAVALSGFVVLVSYTRTVYLGLAVVLVVSLLASRGLRSALGAALPVLLALALVGSLVVARAAPNLIATLEERVSAPAATDTSVQWREQAYRTVLSGVREEPVLGVGFGRKTSFSINHMPNEIEGDPHNGYIYLYAGGGLLALAAFALLAAVFLLDTGRRWRWADPDGRMLLAWSAATWFVFVLHAASEPVFTEPVMIAAIWTCMLLPALVTRPGAPPTRSVARGRW